MAAVAVFRIAIVVGPALVVVARWAQGPGPAKLPQWLQDMLTDPDRSDAEKTLTLSEALGTLSEVATYPEPFELRKLQVVFGRSSGASIPEDNAVCSFHFVKLTAGAPVDTWVAGDFTTIETALNALWTTLKPKFATTLNMKQFRWYKTGPELEAALGGPGRTGPPVRVVDQSAPGTSPLSPPLAQAPQVAITITEKTAVPNAWGRVYWPAPLVTDTVYDGAGRLISSYQTILGNAFDTFYEAARAAGTPVVVYSAAKPERETKGGTTLPAKDARALTVDQLQVDDLLDVIRSRRWSTPLLRLQRDVAA